VWEVPVSVMAELKDAGFQVNVVTKPIDTADQPRK
jgi:hypothetical protein